MPSRHQGQMIQAMGPGTSQPITVSLSTVTANNSASPLTNIPRTIRLWSSVDCFIRVGGASVEATTSDHPLTARVPEVFDLGTQQYIAGIVSTGTGTLFISELE